jgi:hypothetical protein
MELGHECVAEEVSKEKETEEKNLQENSQFSRSFWRPLQAKNFKT